MKKFWMLLMCMCLLMGIGCGKEEDTQWIDESAAMIGSELTEGQFVLDGVVYEFPMTLQYWLDNGWHISNNYDNKNTFKLDPWYNSDEFELFNEEGDWVRVSAYNNSDTAAKLNECMVYSVYLSLSEVDVVFPAGMTKRNTQEELLAAYGEADLTEEEDSTLKSAYFFNQEEEWQCMVVLNTYTEDVEDPFYSVDYQMMFFEDFWNAWVDAGGMEAAVEYYVDADLKASFSGNYEDCVNYAIATREQAEEWHEQEIAYYSDALIWYAGIDSAYIDEATQSRFDAVSKTILEKAAWEFKSVEADRFGKGTATMVIHPTNFLEIIVDGLNAASEEWNTKYANVDIEAMSDTEYAVLELDYADMVLKVMEAKAAEAAAGEAVELVCDLDIENSVLTEDSWLNIYDALMGLYVEE